MTVTIDIVAIELGRLTPEAPVADQWQAWIDRAYRLIEARLGETSYAELDPDLLDDVVLMAVAEHVRAWRDTTSSRRTVAIDDGSVSYSYDTAVGLLTIPDDLWAMLQGVEDSQAFTIEP